MKSMSKPSGPFNRQLGKQYQAAWLLNTPLSYVNAVSAVMNIIIIIIDSLSQQLSVRAFRVSNWP